MNESSIKSKLESMGFETGTHEGYVAVQHPDVALGVAGVQYSDVLELLFTYIDTMRTYGAICSKLADELQSMRIEN